SDVTVPKRFRNGPGDDHPRTEAPRERSACEFAEAGSNVPLREHGDVVVEPGRLKKKPGGCINRPRNQPLWRRLELSCEPCLSVFKLRRGRGFELHLASSNRSPRGQTQPLNTRERGRLHSTPPTDATQSQPRP